MARLRIFLGAQLRLRYSYAMSRTNVPMKNRPVSEPALTVPTAPAETWFGVGKLLLVLLGLMVAMNPEIFFKGHVFFYRDAGIFNYPAAYYHRNSFLNGEIPLWNPFNNCGIPFLAQWNNMVLYPLSWFYILLPVPWSITFFTLGHLFLAAAGMYFLARRWTGNSFAASVAGLAFAFNGITLNSLMWPNSCASIGWMPWVVLVAESAFKQGGRKIIYAALIGATQMLAGVPEIIVLTWLVVAGVCLIEWSAQKKGAVLWRFGAIVLLVTGLTAAQMLPFLDLLAHSQRSTGTGADSVWAMPLSGLANFFVPLFHTARSFLNVPVLEGQQWSSSYYLGIGIFVLAFFAMRFVRHARLWLLIYATVIGCIFALGKNALIYEWVQQLVPAIGFLRYPVKWIQLMMFSLPLLAAFGIAWLQSKPAENTEAAETVRRNLILIGAIIVAIIGIVIACEYFYPKKDVPRMANLQNGVMRAIFLFLMVGLIYKLIQLPSGKSRHICGMTLLVLLGLDMLTHSPNLNPTIAGKEYGPLKPTMKHVPELGGGRAMTSPFVQRKMQRAGGTNVVDDFLLKRRTLYKAANLYDQVPKVNGMSSLYIKEQADMEHEMYDLGQLSNGLLDFLAVEQFSGGKELYDWQPRRNLPVATIGQMPIFADENGTLLGMTADRFDPEKTVYLPPEAEAVVTARNFAQGSRLGMNIVSPHLITMLSETKEPAWVVLSQTYYHPWTAYVDNQPTPIWRANYAYQAIEVMGGSHQIKLVYEDRIFNFGALLSIASLVLCAVIWMRLKPRR